jgi:hypothetical protein
MAVFHQDKTILLIADNFRGSKNMLSKIKIAWLSLPKWMLEILDIESLERESATEIKLKNGSLIVALPTTEHTGRGYAASLVVVDEAAINDKLEEGWKAIYSTTQAGGGKMVVFSTPKGNVGQFYKLYQESLSGKNTFVRTELPWNVHPEHDQKWFDEETKNMDEKQINQELLCSFGGSGDTFFNNNTLDWLREIQAQPTAYNGPTQATSTDMWIWKTPEPNTDYVISADVSSGGAEDYSSFYVIDKKTFEIVAEYKGKIAPDKYADFLYKIGEQYNNALIVQEKNSVGIGTAIRLRDLNYPNLYWEKYTQDDLLYLSDEQKQFALPGFTTKSGSKPGNRDELMMLLEEALRNKKILIKSKRFLDEANTFINGPNKKPIAAKGKNLFDLINIFLFLKASSNSIINSSLFPGFEPLFVVKPGNANCFCSSLK